MSLIRWLEKTLRPGTIERLDRLESSMADLTTSVSNLRDAVGGVAARIQAITDVNGGQLQELRDAITAERERYDALVSAEDVEDIGQNAELAEAREATDAVLAAQSDAADQINAEAGRLNELAAPASEPTDPEVPVDPADPADPETPVDPEPEVPGDGEPVEPSDGDNSGEPNITPASQ